MSKGGYRGGFNPFRRSGKFATANGADKSSDAGAHEWANKLGVANEHIGATGTSDMNDAIRAAAGRGAAAAPAAGPRSYAEHAPAVAAALAGFEGRTRHNPAETGAIITPDGTVLLEKAGGKRAVKFTKAELKKFKGAIVTHNHPYEPGKGDTSFSGGDVSMALQHGVSELRAVVGRFNHVMQMRKPGTQEPTEVGEDTLFDVLYADSELAQKLVARKGKDPETAAWREQIIHEQNLAWAQEHGYVYYRENIETGEVEGYGHD